MFNDGTNQIPAQNQPGLDATGIMWYKNVYGAIPKATQTVMNFWIIWSLYLVQI